MLYFPESFIDERATEEITSLLVSQLGPEAVVADVNLGWRTAVLNELSLPLGASGSILEIRRIEFGVDPLAFFSQPEHYRRVIKSVSVIDPRCTIAVPLDSSSRVASTSSSDAPELHVPPEIFSILASFDSLQTLTISGGIIQIAAGDSIRYLAREIQGSLKRDSSNEYDVRIDGYYLTSHRNRLQLRGALKPSSASFDFITTAVIPAGELQNQIDSLTISSTGGELRLRTWTDANELHYEGSVAISDLQVNYSPLEVTFPKLHGDIIEHRLDVVIPEYYSAWFTGDIFASLELFGARAIHARGVLDVDSLSRLAILDSALVGIDGRVDSEFRVLGSLNDPTLFFSWKSNEIRRHSERIADLSGSIRATKSDVFLDRLQFNHRYGTASISGNVGTASDHKLSIQGELELSQRPSLLGLQTGISTLGIEAIGDMYDPRISFTAIDDSSQVRGSAVLDQTRSSGKTGWVFAFRNESSDRVGEVIVLNEANTWSVNAENAQYLLGILFPQVEAPLSPISEFLVDFQGNDDSGELSLWLTVLPDSSGLLPQALRELQFVGSYDKLGAQYYDVDGDWSGLTASADSFFGKGGIEVLGGMLRFHNFFIDEVGKIQGTVHLEEKTLDVGVSIDELPFNRFPLQPAFFAKSRLDGTLSGEVRLSGSFEKFDWMNSLTLVDGTVFDVPGYWINLDVQGENFRADSIELAFGRDIRRILDARGMVDFEQDTIDIRAVSAAAEANDFLLSLTGVPKIMTGELDAQVLVSGSPLSPTINAEIDVKSGELLGEFYVDRFKARVELTENSSGVRVFRVPSVTFGKQDTYRFFGEMNTEMIAGGSLNAHLEGSGDFLDLLDQIDGTFDGFGSQGQLFLDFGGTYDEPKFKSGILQISEGKLHYPSAAPEMLDAELLIHVAPPGIVDSGRIRFSNEDQFLQIQFLQDYEEHYFDLKPLVIPSPRLELGILEWTTGADGMDLRLPGFMEPEWLGTFQLSGGDFDAVTISAEDSTQLYMSGGITISNSRFTFPFVSSGRGRKLPVTEWLLSRLYEANWNLEVDMGSGNHYDVEITGFKDSEFSEMLGNQPVIETLAEYFDHLTVDAIVEPTENPLLIRETLEDTSFYLEGRLTSNRGRVDYLDQSFSIDYVYADFDETDVMPILEGRAITYGLDSLNRSVPVYLTIYEIDTENDARYRQGRFDDITYVLESDEAETQEETLALLGYGAGELGAKAEQVFTRTVLSAAKRRWLDPIARQLEQSTIFDEIALTPGGGRTQRLFRQQREQVQSDTTRPESIARYFTGSHVTVGKYLSDDIFLTYTGELSEGHSELEGSRLGLVHFWNLEFRMDPLARDLVLDFEVEYDEIERRRDESVALKYSFTLEP